MSALQENNQSIEPQQIQMPSMADAINVGVASIIQNIQAAQRRVNCDDLTERFFENAITGAQMTGAQLIDISNQDVDAYNQLSNDIENAELRIGLQQSEIRALNAQLEKQQREQAEAIDNATFESKQIAHDAESRMMGLENQINESTALLELRNDQIRTLERSHREIMKLDPIGMSKRYKTAQNERNEARATIQKLQTENKTMNRGLSEARVAYAQKKGECTRLAGELLKFETLQKEMYGISSKRLLSSIPHPEHGVLSYTPRLIAYGIVADKKHNISRPYIVSGLNFAFQICCDMGYSMDIRINEWLMPNVQPLAMFSKYQPEGWVEFFHELIMNECESRRPELVRRVEWAKETMISDLNLPISDDLHEYLIGRDLNSVFDIVHFRKEGLVNVHELQPEDAERLLDLCYAEVNAWEKNHGGEFCVR